MKLFNRFLMLLPVLFLTGAFGSMVVVAQDIKNNSQEAELETTPQTLDELGVSEAGSGQQLDNPYLNYDENSVHAIPEPHILFRMKIWREIYLKEPKNKPFFSRGQEITKFILDGVEEGAITPYSDESFSKPMTKKEFMEQLTLPKEESLSAEEKALNLNQDDGWGSVYPAQGNAVQATEPVGEFFLPNELTCLEIMEWLIFDKVSSNFINDIQAIRIIIPAEKFATGLRRNVATFKYKEVAAYLDSRPKEALWVNIKNNAANIPFTEAIEMRLFDSRIVKLENPDNFTLEDIYNKTPNQHLYASKEMEEKLIEIDQFLWEN